MPAASGENLFFVAESTKYKPVLIQYKLEKNGSIDPASLSTVPWDAKHESQIFIYPDFVIVTANDQLKVSMFQYT